MRRNFFGRGRYDAFDEPAPLDLSRDPAENMKELLKEITSKEEMTADKRMGFVNNFTKLIQHVDERTDFSFTPEEICKCLTLALMSPSKEVRASGLRAFRHMFFDEVGFAKLLECRVDIFVTRSLDMKQVFEVERVQALRFVRKVIAVCPHLCPMSLAASLVSIGMTESDDADRLHRACIATLCELAIKNPPLASYCGAINVITRSVLETPIPRFNESLIVTLLYLLSRPESRPFVRSDVGLEGILAPFTDLHYRHSADVPESQIQEDRKKRYEASKMAIVTVFRSWTGIISICRPDGKGLQSLLGVFCLPNADVRKWIMNVLYEIFQLDEPDWTDDFDKALLSIDPSKGRDGWTLSEGFVAEEAKAILPHRVTGRFNLRRNYMALVLAAFMNAGLFESLVEVITSSNDFISVRATILLGELLHMANTLLPPECATHTHCLPSLVNTATSFEVSAAERGRASAAINCLDRLHTLKKRGPVPCSLFLDLIVEQAHTLESKSVPDKLHRERLFHSLNKDLDEAMFSAIRETQVSMEKDFKTWDWDVIESILQSPLINLKKLEETSNQKFIRNLMYIYKPSSQKFCAISISNGRAKKYSNVGLLLIDFLLDTDDLDGIGPRILQELVQEIGECLQEAMSPNISNGVLSNSSVLNTLSRHYFLFIGKLSCSNHGCKLLERTSIYHYLLELCSAKSQDKLLKLLVASLDYSQPLARIVLSKLLTASNVATRLYATRHMRVLLRAKVSFFNDRGIELLVAQLYDTDSEVSMEAADILDEACEEEAKLQYLVQLRPVLLHLGEKGMQLLIRFVSVEVGFYYLSNLGYLTVILEEWRTVYNKKYVRWVEEQLAETLTTYTKPVEEGVYVRRSNTKHVIKDAFLPPHLYGQLVQKKHGFKLLQKTADVEMCAKTVRFLEPSSQENLLEIKAALWALGHLGSTTWGIAFLVEEAILPDIVHMAEESEHFVLRGTCFFVLGLIAKTREGADQLRDLEWESVRHHGDVRWPVVETKVENKEEVIPLTLELNESYSSFGLGSITESMDSRMSSGGIYLGDDSKSTPENLGYDKISGIYIGDETPTSRKPAGDDHSEGGILSRWFEEAERRKKIAERESALYDELSGVYVGDGQGDKTPEYESKMDCAPGGILERLCADLKPNSKKHRRNFSEGNFACSAEFLNRPSLDVPVGKRRTLSNVDSPFSSPSCDAPADVNDLGRSASIVGTQNGLHLEQLNILTSQQSQATPKFIEENSLASLGKSDGLYRADYEASSHFRSGSNVSTKSTDSNQPAVSVRAQETNHGRPHVKPWNRPNQGGEVNDLVVPNMHFRSGSNISTVSGESTDLSESSSLQDSPTFSNLNSVAKDLGEAERGFESSWEGSSVRASSRSASYRSGSGTDRSPCGSVSSQGLDRAGNTTESPQTERRHSSVTSEGSSHSSVTRQRSVSLTEKRRMGSPSLGMIPETRSSSFHGSTDFDKIRTKSRAYSEVSSLTPRMSDSSNGSTASVNSLAKVKILSDKTIVFHSGVEPAKERAMSVDSANVNELRRDRLLARSQISSEESDCSSVRSSRCRGASIDKIDLARKLGLKTGDLAKPAPHRSRSVGSNGSSEGYLRRRILNKNQLASPTDESSTVISADCLKNSRSSIDYAVLTSARDAFGYVALSNLRRQRSFNRDLEAKVNTYKPGGPAVMSRSVSALEFSSLAKRDSYPSPRFDIRPLRSPVSTPANKELLGLCLPLDLSALFQVNPQEYQGSWAAHFSPYPTIVAKLEEESTESAGIPDEHVRTRCLACMGSGDSVNLDGKQNVIQSESSAAFRGEQHGPGLSRSTSSSSGSLRTPTESSAAEAVKMDDASPLGRAQVRKEVLRLVLNLSSAVGSKSHQEGLMTLKEKFPLVFEDLCLYCEVSDTLGLYKFKLPIRRFIQGLFDNVVFNTVAERAQQVLAKHSS